MAVNGYCSLDDSGTCLDNIIDRPLNADSVATPVDWKHGDKCMVVPTLSDDAAKEKFGTFDVVDVPSGKRYIRMTVGLFFYRLLL